MQLVSLHAFIICAIIQYYNTGNDNVTLSKANIAANVGENVTVYITYEANPMPTVSVTKSGNAASGVDLLNTRQFTFYDVEEADTGVYDVEAVNFAGSAHALFTLSVTKSDDGGECLLCIYKAFKLHSTH